MFHSRYSPWAGGALTTILIVGYILYRSALPRPIPDIPYHKDSRPIVSLELLWVWYSITRRMECNRPVDIARYQIECAHLPAVPETFLETDGLRSRSERDPRRPAATFQRLRSVRVLCRPLRWRLQITIFFSLQTTSSDAAAASLPIPSAPVFLHASRYHRFTSIHWSSWTCRGPRTNWLLDMHFGSLMISTTLLWTPYGTSRSVAN